MQDTHVLSDLERRLLDAWHARSTAAGWGDDEEWWAPEVVECVRASYDLDALEGAIGRLARTRARRGTSFDRSLDDLDAFWNEIATIDAPPDFVRAFTVAWSAG